MRGGGGGNIRQQGEHRKKTLEAISEPLLRGKGGETGRVIRRAVQENWLEDKKASSAGELTGR